MSNAPNLDEIRRGRMAFIQWLDLVRSKRTSNHARAEQAYSQSISRLNVSIEAIEAGMTALLFQYMNYPAQQGQGLVPIEEIADQFSKLENKPESAKPESAKPESAKPESAKPKLKKS